MMEKISCGGVWMQDGGIMTWWWNGGMILWW